MGAGEWTVERWTYIGRRWDSNKHKTYHGFRDEEGLDRFFDKAPTPPIIGGAYEVECQHLPGGGLTARIQAANALGIPADSDESVRRGYQVADRTAVTQQEHWRSIQRMAKDSKDIGGLTLRELREILAKHPTSQRWGVLAHVMEYLR